MRIKDFSSTEELQAFVETMRSLSPSTTYRHAERLREYRLRGRESLIPRLPLHDGTAEQK